MRNIKFYYFKKIQYFNENSNKTKQVYETVQTYPKNIIVY